MEQPKSTSSPQKKTFGKQVKAAEEKGERQVKALKSLEIRDKISFSIIMIVHKN